MAGVSAIANVMFPRISALVKQGGEKNKTEIEKYVERSLYGVVWFAVACFFGMLAVAPKFVPFFLGDDFEGAIGVVQLGCLILLPKSFRIILNSECLLPYEKDKGTIVSTILAAISNILLNFIMIPQLGAVGAEIATIISEIIYCIVMLAIIGNQFGTFKIIITSIPFTLFGYCMYQSIAFIGNKVNFNILLSLCVQIFFEGIFYLGLSAIYLTVCLRTFKKRGL